MRTLLLSVACVASITSFHAAASPALDLAPLQGINKIEVLNTKIYKGMCGSAMITVTGVLQTVGDRFLHLDHDTGAVIIYTTTTNKELKLAMGGYVDTYTGVSCVPTKSGNRLLIWSNCGGNGCPSFDFALVDPDKAIVLWPRNPKTETCDEKCATKLLGRKLPVDLSRYNE